MSPDPFPPFLKVGSGNETKFDQLDKSHADVMHNAADMNKRESAKKLPSLEPKTAKESRSILASRHF